MRSSPSGVSQTASQPVGRSSKQPAGVSNRRVARAGGIAPHTTSTRSTSWRGLWAGRRYQTRDGLALLSGRPRAPGNATLGRPGGPTPERLVRPAASIWAGATATPTRPRASSANVSNGSSTSAAPDVKSPASPSVTLGTGSASSAVNPVASARSEAPSARAASAAATVAGEVTAYTLIPESAISRASAAVRRSPG